MIKSISNGHDIYYDGEQWRFLETNKQVDHNFGKLYLIQKIRGIIQSMPEAGKDMNGWTLLIIAAVFFICQLLIFIF